MFTGNNKYAIWRTGRSVIGGATALLLIGCIRAQANGSIVDRNAWMNALQQAQDLNLRGQPRQALDKFQAVLANPLPDAEIHAYVLSQIADAEIQIGAYAVAEDKAREALTLLTDAERIHTGAFAIAEGVLGCALRARGSFDRANELAEHAVSLGEQTLNSHSTLLGILMTDLALVSLDRKEFRRGVKLCEKAVRIFENSGKGHRIELGTAYNNLASAYALQRQPKKALAALERAVAAWNGILPPNHPFRAYALNTRLIIYTQLKAFPEAERIISNMLAAGPAGFSSDSLERAILLKHAAGVYIAEKDYERAEPLLREAVEIARRHLPVGHPALRSMLIRYSFVLDKLNLEQDAELVRAEANTVLATPQEAPLSRRQEISKRMEYSHATAAR